MVKKRHLCIDARMISCAGIGRFIKDLLPGFSEKFSLSLLYYEKDHKELAFNDSLQLIPMKSAIYSIKEQLELPLKIPPCDIFYSPHINIPLLPICAQKRVTTIHDVYHLANLAEFAWHKQLYAKLIYNKALSLSTITITISNFSKEEIEKYCSLGKKKNPQVIYPGLGNLFENPEKRNLPRAYLLAVGNLKPNKNLYRLLLAYEKVHPEEPLFIVGKREGFITKDTKLASLIEESSFLQKRVYLTGFVSDAELLKLYLSAKALLFPSLYEGFGYPPLEAMSCSCPVMASRAASIPEICGEAAYYVDPFDIDSIGEGILKIIHDNELRNHLIQRGYEQVKKFPLRKCIENYTQLFENL